MRNFSLRALSSLLLVGLWVTGAAAQTWTAQPTETKEASSSAAAAAAPSSATQKCSLEVRSLQSQASKRFSATKILDLDFHVRLNPTPAGEQLVRIEIETPNGHLFQTLIVPFSAEPSEVESRRKVSGFPRPVKVQLVRQTARGAASASSEVVGRLPVAGTPIVHSSLYGRWAARAYLGDETKSCGRGRAFFITP